MAELTIDEEVLETLTYERSKIWSNILRGFEKMPHDKEITLDDFDKVFKTDDEDYEKSDMDEAEESDVSDDVTNVKTTQSRAELTMMLCNDNNEEQKKEVQEILDSTMPVIQEHTRKWKAAGLDRILNTFDSKKIEEHVGDWLRRNNSAYGEKSPESRATLGKKSHEADYSESDSEAGSMHSIETASYIRASRKHSSPSKYSTMSTIKMYRNMPLLRKELRDKYGCEVADYEREHEHHMQALRCRRQQKEEERIMRHQMLTYHQSPRHFLYKTSLDTTIHQRRKQYRKRRVMSPFLNSSSSDDGCAQNMKHYACSTCHKHVVSKSTRCCCCSTSTYQRHNRPLASRSFDYAKSQHRRTLCRQNSFDIGMLPRVFENECSCCNSDRLCTNVVHIANSSTEEWMVENSDISEESINSKQSKSAKKGQIQLPKISEQTPKSVKKERASTNLKTTPLRKRKNSEDDAAEANKLNKASRRGQNTFNGKLSLILEESPKSSKKERKSTTSKTTKPIKYKETPIAPPACATITTNKAEKLSKSKSVDKELGSGSVRESKLNCKLSITISDTDGESDTKKTGEKKTKIQKATGKKTLVRNKTKAVKCKTHANISVNEKQSNSNELPPLVENLVFNNYSVTCNSTAVVDGPAKQRSLNKVDVKRAAAVSTTLQSSSSSEDIINPSPSRLGAQEDADCAEVGSTTTYVERDKRAIEISEKGILLHAPSEEHGQANSSIHYNVTEQCLSGILGARVAGKILKYHLGRRSFDSRSYVYYRPSPKLAAALNAGNQSISSSSTSSEDDVFETMERYGVFYSEYGAPKQK